ncbi:MAG: M20/M25/M40 family metallo-hydrolase [Bacillota bacterium]
MKEERPSRQESMTEYLAARPIVRRGLAFLENCEDEYVELITNITEIPAPSHDEFERGRFVRQKMEEFGFPVTQTDSAGNVLGMLPGEDPSRVIVSMAHMDTVFSRDVDVSVRRSGNRLAGPGVSDNSASVACMLLLGKILVEHLPLSHPVIFIGNVGEEGLGDLKGARYFCDHVEEYDFDGFRLNPDDLVFLNIDGSWGNLTHMGVGSRRMRIEFTGEGGHSWGAFGCSSAIHGLGTAIANIARIDVPSDPRTTYNVGVISGGISVNSIAQQADMLLDMRSVSQDELDRLEQKVFAGLDRAARETDTRYTSEVVGDRPTGSIPETSDLVQGLLKLGREQGCELALRAGSTDSNIPLAMGWPAVTMGFKRSENGHRVNEFLYIDSLVPGIRFALLCFVGLLYDLY